MFGSIIFIIVILVIINNAKKSAEQIRRANTPQNPVDRQRQDQMKREQQRRNDEAAREAEMKRREAAQRAEADRAKEEQRRREAQRLREEQQRREEQLRQEAAQREEVWEGMKAQGSYRSAARKDELLRKYKQSHPNLTMQEIEEDLRQGKILSRSSDIVNEDFDYDMLEEEDVMAKIDDLMILGPQYTFSKERDFLDEAQQMLWENKVS